MSLATTALRRPVTTVAATLALCLAGAASLSRLPVSLLPDVSLPVLTIRTSFPGAAAEEVSRLVAEPIEAAIASTPGLVELRSVSRNNEATTTVRFAWGTDMPATVLAVRERLDNARARLPTDATRPTLLTSDPGERPIAILALASANGDLRSVARTARDVHARRLEQLAGVASAAIVGAPEDEIRIDVDPERMRALGLTPGDVAAAVRTANAAARGGTVRRGQFRYAVRALTEFRAMDEIAGIPVGPRGSGATLADVGTVRLAAADPRTAVRLDGAPAVGLVVYKDAGANTVAVTRDIRRTLATLRAEVPAVRVTVVAEQARFVTDALSNLTQEIILGGLLSLLVIVVMMGDVRSSLAVAAIVPLSILVSLGALQALGVTINVLSLGGLALGVGLLVDNAIMVAEATGRHREAGVGVLEAAGRAASELSGPLIAGTLTTVLVFGPIVFVRGLAAALFRDLSLSVVASLTASLILALTLMPVMLVGRRGYEPGGQTLASRPPRFAAALVPLGRRLAGWYEDGMRWSLRHPGPVFAAAALVVAITIGITAALPKEILPRVEEGALVAALQLPEGTALEETARQVARVEAAAAQLGAENVYARVGAATDEEVLAGADAGSSASAQLVIPVPRGSAARFADRLRAALPDLSVGGALALDLAGQSEFGALIGRAGHVVRLEISAPRRETAEAWADTVRRSLASLPELADVRRAGAASQPAVELALERERIARLGIPLDRVADAVAGGLGGVAASELRETDQRTPIRVRLAGPANENLAAALATVVSGVPVSQLVAVRQVRVPTEVVRVDQRPVSIVEAVAERGGTARATRAVQRGVSALTPPQPAGVTWRLAGAEQERRRTSAELQLVAWLSVALVFLVLAGEFASFTTPLLVMLTVPLAGAGSIAALWLTGQSLNTVALIGIVVMIGLADNEAVVKLDAIRRFRAEGHEIEQAVLLGGRQRLRAIGMTVLTTIVGVLPLLFGIGGGGALYRPLAAAVIGGSVTATLVTFFLLPTAYALVERRRDRRAVGAAGAGGA